MFRLTVFLWPVLLVSFPTAVEVRAAAGDERPNILFIFTDDQSHRSVGCYEEAHPWVKTPNIDRLAAEGVRFTSAYAGTWCLPSRAMVLTGLHPHGIHGLRVERNPISRYKYVRYLLEDEIEELYDLEVDPQELHNLAGDPQHHKRLADLRRRLADELRRTGAPLVRNLPEPKTAGAAEE